MKTIPTNMRSKIRISLCLLMLLMAVPLQAQMFKNLGAGKTPNYMKMPTCMDSEGNLTVLYANKTNDSLVIDIWNRTTETWSNKCMLPALYLTPYSRVYTAVYKNDSLFVYGSFNFNNVSQPGLYYVKDTAVRYLGRMKRYNTPIHAVVDMKVINNCIALSGLFDSAVNASGTGIFSRYMVLYDGSGFRATGMPDNMNTLSGVSTYEMAVNKDSMLLVGTDALFRFVFPNQWKKIPLHRMLVRPDTNLYNFQVGGIGVFNNRFLVLKRLQGGGDSVYTVSDTVRGGYRLRSTPKFRYGGYPVAFKGRLYLNEFGRLWAFGADSLQMLYDGPTDNMTYKLMASDSNLYCLNQSNIVYKNKNYGLIAEFRPDSAEAFGFDTIIGNAFWDKNSNYVFDGPDKRLSFTGIYNATYQRQMSMDSNGYFRDIVPDYNNVAYTLTQFRNDTCLKIPFSGNVMTANTDTGVTVDSIVFPLRRTALTLSNLEFKAYGLLRARLDDTINLHFDLFSRNCDSGVLSSACRIELHPDVRFVSSSPAYASKNGNVLTYAFSNLKPFQRRAIDVKVVYPFSKFSLGDSVMHSAYITPGFAEDSSDNKDTIVQHMVYSYDPNQKMSYPSGIITKDLKKIRYQIDFQNMGNAEARRVTVVDTIDLKLPVYEFQMLEASHPYTVSVSRNNIVTWVFDNINLRPKDENEEKSKGYILFEARLVGGLKIGDSIRNKASIYFDYNEPIITKFATVKRAEPGTELQSITLSNALTVYPNPFDQAFSIQNKGNATEHFSIYNAQGILMQSCSVEANSALLLSTSAWASGVYVLRSDTGAYRFIVRM